MKNLRVYRVVLFVFLSFVVVLDGAVTPALAQQELLTNPGFEAPFISQGGDPSRQVAQGWTAWHLPPPSGAPTYVNQQPDYMPAAPDGARIRGGNNAQLYLTFFATHVGGVYQTVSGITPDTQLTFSVYAYVWSSAFDDVNISEQDGGVTVQVGIDPTGGADPTSQSIVWSQPVQEYDAYTQHVVTATAAGNTVTVFVRSSVTSPAKNNNIYLDDASLKPPAPPPPTATNTIAAPTFTPIPLTVVAPTFTATAVEATEVPSNTPTPGPTATPSPTVPTATLGPSPTLDSSIFQSTIVHTVRPGDTVSRLALLYGSTVQAIVQANGLNSSALIYVGQGLVIPVRLPAPATSTPTWTPVVVVVTATPQTGGGEAPPAATLVPPGMLLDYVIQPGDTLSGIARRFNTTVAALAQLNGIVNPDRIFWGLRLKVPAPGSTISTPTPIPAVTATPVGNVTSYTVQPGDNLYRISVRFGVSMASLIQKNNIADPNRIYVGQVLVIQ